MILNKTELPVSQKCKLFDSLVGLILNFGAEIWGSHEATDVEFIHTKFLRRVLGVKKSTNLAALYGDLGRVPLVVYRKIVMIKYWIKILKQNDSSLVKKTYLLLESDVAANNTNNKNNWAYHIKSMLKQHGLHYIWKQQHETVKQRIFDMYICTIKSGTQK